jgi:mannan endo-1,4-beta-mannosidase
MDVIAFELTRLKNANIPIIWRPLHEADGEWFWWGAFGPESCVTLYRLMFDRFTNYHGLNNLIWLWNSVTPSWYPGADVVDILGYDSYPAIGDHGPVDTQYQELITLGLNEKMVTLPEVGNIPDPTTLRLYHADWSYFVTWDDDYIDTDTYNTLAFKKQIYSDPTVLKLQDLGNWKGNAATSSSSLSSIQATSATSSTSIVKVSITPTPTTLTTSVKVPPVTTISPIAPAPTQFKWGQCAGIGYTGPTICTAGTTCTFSSVWYSQCL